MRRRKQLQPLGIVGPPADQRHLAPLQAVIRQAYRPGRPLAHDLEPRDPVAQFRRQRQRHLAPRIARRKGQRHPRQFPLDPRRIRPARHNLHLQRPRHRQAARRDLHRAIGKSCRMQRQHRARALEHPHRPGTIQRGEKRLAPRPFQPVRKPERVKPLIGQNRRPSLQIARQPGLRLHRRQPPGPGIRRLKHHRFRRIGQPQHRHRPPVTPRLFHQRARPLDPPPPVARIGPAAIQHHQQRPRPRLPLARVQDRPGKGDDRRGNRHHPQQKQPPGRAVRLVILVLQTQQQRHPRKPPPDRRGRHGAQQQPQHRQGHQRPKQHRRHKADRAQHEHHRPPSSAR